MDNKKRLKEYEKTLKDAREKKEAAAKRSWDRGFQTTTEKDILSAGKK